MRAEYRRSRKDEVMCDVPTGRDAAGAGSVGRPEVEDIMGRLREVLIREEEKENGENLCREWQEAAEVIDRFLFWIFVVGTLLATVTSLVILPLTKTPPDGSQFLP